MRNGIYKANFGAGDITNLGLVAVKDGRITGCDHTHFIQGNFTADGNRFSGNLVLTRHSALPGVREIANLDVIEASFSGSGSTNFGQFDAQVIQKRGLTVWVKFHWVCGL